MKKFDLFYVRVDSTKQRYEFIFVIHRSESPQDHQIEDDFYGENIPQGLHFEAEIREKDISELNQQEHRSKLHIHESKKTKKHYVCWTGNISRHKMMHDMLVMWCAGSVYTMESGIQFEKIIEEKKGDVNDFEGCKAIFDSLGICVNHTHARFGLQEGTEYTYHNAQNAEDWEQRQGKPPRE